MTYPSYLPAELPVPVPRALARDVSLEDNSAMAGRPRSQRGPRGALADRLRAAREARGISQSEAAAELGIARSWLAMVESGSRKPQGLARLALLAWCAESLGERFSLIHNSDNKKET